MQGFVAAGLAAASAVRLERIEARVCEGPRFRKISGESPSGKAPDFDSGIRRFDPYLPSHLTTRDKCYRTRRLEDSREHVARLSLFAGRNGLRQSRSIA